MCNQVRFFLRAAVYLEKTVAVCLMPRDLDQDQGKGDVCGDFFCLAIRSNIRSQRRDRLMRLIQMLYHPAAEAETQPPLLWHSSSFAAIMAKTVLRACHLHVVCCQHRLLSTKQSTG